MPITSFQLVPYSVKGADGAIERLMVTLSRPGATREEIAADSAPLAVADDSKAAKKAEKKETVLDRLRSGKRSFYRFQPLDETGTEPNTYGFSPVSAVAHFKGADLDELATELARLTTLRHSTDAKLRAALNNTPVVAGTVDGSSLILR